MANLTSLTLTAGAPGDTGSISTLDALMNGKTLADLAQNSSLAAKGTAGAPSADVVTIQGVGSMTAVKTDGSGVTQPVSNAYLTQFGAGYYVAVAASQTDSVIQSSTGAIGDYLDGVLVIPATTAPGVVTIKDNATALISYPGGGTTALLTLTPFFIPVGAVSRSGAWKITTGANVSVLAIGKFA